MDNGYDFILVEEPVLDVPFSGVVLFNHFLLKNILVWDMTTLNGAFYMVCCFGDTVDRHQHTYINIINFWLATPKGRFMAWWNLTDLLHQT